MSLDRGTGTFYGVSPAHGVRDGVPRVDARNTVHRCRRLVREDLVPEPIRGGAHDQQMPIRGVQIFPVRTLDIVPRSDPQ